MDRTVPRAATDAIALYERTYWSLLRSSRDVPVRTLEEAHLQMRSALHIGARDEQPDMAAFLYAVLRVPMLHRVQHVVMGQSDRVFAAHGYPDVESWSEVSAPARRRRSFWDNEGTLAVYIASRSDVDDLVPILVAYQIERDKLRPRLARPAARAILENHEDGALDDEARASLAEAADLDEEDLERLHRVWGDDLVRQLLILAESRCRIQVRLLSGSLAEYRRATRRWWGHVIASLPTIAFEERPVYFVSSNMHALANLLSGHALAIEPALAAFVAEGSDAALRAEYADILARNVPSSRENFLYYVLKKYEAAHPEAAEERRAAEAACGIHRVPSEHVFDVAVQVVELARLDPERIDPRLRLPGLERLAASDALLVNIDFPLGMAAYQVLSEVAVGASSVRGVYVTGKAATLNGRIGDVMIASVVHDEHSGCTYLFDNRFRADDVAPHLVYGAVLDHQKAISVLGTFLQNEGYMAVFYKEGYTVMEMEAGPYLSAVYEMVRPKRYPQDEIVHLTGAPFPIGFIHYASDTPFSKGKNLGSQNLGYYGIDPTYAAMAAIAHAVLGDEIATIGVQEELLGTR